MDETAEGRELLVLVVGWRASGGVGIVEDLHADDGVNVEAYQEERHEFEDDGEDFQNHREYLFEFL